MPEDIAEDGQGLGRSSDRSLDCRSIEPMLEKKKPVIHVDRLSQESEDDPDDEAFGNRDRAAVNFSTGNEKINENLRARYSLRPVSEASSESDSWHALSVKNDGVSSGESFQDFNY